MIYILYACQAPFKCCGAACGKACKCCESVCKGCCDAISNFCKSVGETCSKPLGGFVLTTIAAMAAVSAMSGYAYGKALPGEPHDLEYNDDCGKVKIFCLANIGCAFVHAASAVYIQRALVKKVRSIAAERGLEEDSMTPEDITTAARYVFLHDFIFCFYFFAAAAIFAYNCSNIVNLGKCSGDGLVWSGSALMIAYGFVSANYAFCWYCGQCCFGKARKVKTVQQPQRQAIDAPAKQGDAEVPVVKEV